MKRLDEILLKLGLLTEEQIRHALTRQKTHGGKLGSNLLYQHYLTEKGLVRALSIQSGFEGITLENLEISATTLNQLPARLARARKVMPFKFIPQKGVLRIAASDPTLPKLKEELKRATEAKRIELFVASEVALEQALEKYYPLHVTDKFGANSSHLTNHLNLSEKPEWSEFAGSFCCPSNVIIVAEEKPAVTLLKSLLQTAGSNVQIVDSIDGALAALKERFIELVVIRQALADDQRSVESAFRALNLRTEIRWFENAETLPYEILNINPGDDALKNIELLITFLLAVRGDRDSRAVMVGRYSARICDKLGLPHKDRQRVATAGYLHHLSQYSSGESDGESSREQIIGKTSELLDSLNFDEYLGGILRNTYTDLRKTNSSGDLSLETLGGNIVTAADMLCDYYAAHERITLVKLEEVKELLFDQTGLRILPEVFDALIHSLQEECLNQELTEYRGEVVMYYHNDQQPDPFITYHLNSTGIRVTNSTNIDDLVQVCRRRTPDVIVLNLAEDIRRPMNVIECVCREGIDFTAIPGVIISSEPIDKTADELGQLGINQLVADTDRPERLSEAVIEIINRDRHRKSRKSEDSAVARGSLSNINLIDLIQALGPGRKTVKITLTEASDQIDIYLQAGSIVHANLGDIVGPSAIFEGIRWETGEFCISNVDPDEIPEQNVDMPNELILMEGCRLMDEDKPATSISDRSTVERN